MNYKYLKRFFDVFSSIAGLILTFPITAIITLYLVFYNDGKPFFFTGKAWKRWGIV
jgi:undecaprenyl phosphate N,N'-diacetylbacillosamine 1-phosphate transferase